MTHPSEKDFDRDSSESQVELPNPDLNPMVNETLGRNLGRWAQVYFTNAPENRDKAVGDLLRELQDEGEVALRKGPKSEKSVRQVAEDERPLVAAEDTIAAAPRNVTVCPQCKFENTPAQRFCGLCGANLKVAPRPGNAGPRQTIAPNNIDWLREQPLSSFRAFEDGRREERNWVGTLVALFVAVVIAIFSFYTWQTRSRSDIRPPTETKPIAPAPPPPLQANPSAQPEQPPIARPEQPPIVPLEQPVPDAKKVPAIELAEPLPAEEQPKANIQAKSPEPKLAESEPAQRKENGPGVGRSNQTASATANTSGDAELAMAQSYLYGVNGPRDTRQAAKWLWKAVGKQNRTALLLLADLYEKGDGVPKNCDQAQLLLVAAAKKGLPEAGERLRYLQSAGCR